MIQQRGYGVLTVTDVTDGINTATIYLYQRTISSPTAPTGTFTYTFSTGILSGGSLGDWKQSIAECVNNTGPLWVITSNVNSPDPTVEVSSWSTPVKLAEDGDSIKEARELYYFKSTSDSSPQPINNNTTIYEDTNSGHWTSKVPAYSAGGTYYTCIEILLTDNTTKDWSDPVENKALTDSNYNALIAKSIAEHNEENAQGALSISRATQQHFWFNTTTQGNLLSGAYITDTAIDTFKNGKSGGYLLARSDGLEFGRGNNKFIDILAQGISTDALTFYEPFYNNPALVLNKDGMTVYKDGNLKAFYGDEVALYGGNGAAPYVYVNSSYAQILKDSNNYTLINANGMQVHQGGAEVASFGATSRIGKNDESHLEMDYHSFQMKDKEGSVYVHFSDLRDANGDYEMTESWEGDGAKKQFSTALPAEDTNYTVKVNGTVVTSGLTKTTTYFKFSTAPASGDAITATYITRSQKAKAYTLGTRTGGSSNIGIGSVAEGSNVKASADNSHAEGYYTTASGNDSHAEGGYTTASGYCSHAEGYYTTASGRHSHAEGYDTTASGHDSHAEGYDTTASGYCSHAEGYSTAASGDYSHAEGLYTTASGNGSHAEGIGSVASEGRAHAEGFNTTASGEYSHAEGYYTTASGRYSHAEGSDVKASSDYQHVQGMYNVEDTSGVYADIVGNGTSANACKNISALGWDGTLHLKGNVYVGCNDDSTGGSLLGKVTGVKGNAESSYRTGNVNLTPANIGALASNGTAVASEKLKNFFQASGSTSGRPTSANLNYHDNYLRYFLATASMTTGKPPEDAQIIHLPWDNSGWDRQIAIGSNGMYWRGEDGNGNWGAWKTVTTGADWITSQGTSSGWYYRKWNSGKIEAWTKYDAGNQTPAQWVTGWYYKDIVVTIPSGIFSATPTHVLATNSGSDYQFSVFAAVPVSATSIRIRAVKPNSGAANPIFSIHASNMV